MVFPAPASPPSPDRKRRGKYFAILGTFLAVLVPLGAIALLSHTSGEDTAETTVPPVTETTLPVTETTLPVTETTEPPSPQAVVAAALAATNELVTYKIEVDEQFDDGFYMGARGLLSGPDSQMVHEFGATSHSAITVDGRSFVESSDGRWMETVDPARLREGSADPVGEMWRSLEPFVVVEGSTTGGTFVLACPEDQSIVDADFLWICEGGFESRPEITLDPSLSFVTRFYAEGDIPVFPGATLHGSITITIEVSDVPLAVELPDPIDLSGIECLADALGAPGVSASVLSVLIDDNTTTENSVLFGGCGYEIYPPGVDFAPG